jgi:mannose-6-phosphate isomerase-like protein (cupin superfamily)
MSYPPPRYHGDSGEATASLRRHDAEPELTYPNGVAAHYLSTGASTDGRFGLYRWDFGPSESGPDPHFHRSISEAFFVLSGEVRLFDGTGWATAGAGDYLFVPEGGVHGFRGADGASMLLLFAAGAPRQDYFETLARVAGGETMTAQEREEFMLRHDTFWV